MRRLIYILVLLLFVSCYDDKGNYDYEDINTVGGKDERLDDGSTDIDSLDAFEYTIERDMKYLIEEVEDV